MAIDLRMKYIDMVFYLAVTQKWYEGRAQHGPLFDGEALPSLYEEQLDAWNYVSIAEQNGDITEAEARELRLRIHSVAAMVKAIHEKRRKRYGGGDGGE